MQEIKSRQKNISNFDIDMMAELDENAPPEYKCPITLSIMKDPVIMPDGQTYEREAIKQALNINPISPITRKPMNMKNALTNYALKSLIDKYIQDYKRKNNINISKVNENCQDEGETNNFNVEVLVSMGFDRNSSIKALNNSNNNISLALDLLTNNKKKERKPKVISSYDYDNRPNIHRNNKIKEARNLIIISIIVFLIVFISVSEIPFIVSLRIHFLNTTVIIMNYLDKFLNFIGPIIINILSIIGQIILFIFLTIFQLFAKLCEFVDYFFPILKQLFLNLYSKSCSFIAFISPYIKNAILVLSTAIADFLIVIFYLCQISISAFYSAVLKIVDFLKPILKAAYSFIYSFVCSLIQKLALIFF